MECEKCEEYPGITNACALDSVLYIFYHIQKNTMVKNRVRIRSSSTIGIVMDLLSNKQSDMARYNMTKANRKFMNIQLTDECYNIYSSVGDWLNLFSRYLKFESTIVTKCDYCDKVIKKKHQANSVNIDAFNRGYDTLVLSKMVTKVVNVCNNVDVNLVDNISDNSSDDDNDTGCNGNMTKTTRVMKIPPVLCVYASLNVRGDFLFSDLVRNIDLLGNKLVLHSAVLTDGSHFKTIIQLNNKHWLHYDGMVNGSQYHTMDVSDMDVNEKINFQGKGYGVIATFYINTNHDAVSVTKKNRIIDSNLCNVNINIDKKVSGLCEMTTNSVEGAIDLDSKKPAAKIRPRQATQVLYLPYAMMDTVICVEEKEENDFVEWGVMKTEDKKYQRMKEPLFIGDTVQYFHPMFVYGSEDGLQNGILQSFDWVNKKVTLNTMLTQGEGFRLRRINGYNEPLNKIIDQDGLTRCVEDFDWKILPE